MAAESRHWSQIWVLGEEEFSCGEASEASDSGTGSKVQLCVLRQLVSCRRSGRASLSL